MRHIALCPRCGMRMVQLTQRQHEVLQLVAQGKTNRQIAQELVMQVGTAKVYVSQLFLLLDATNRVEATLAAQRLGLLEKLE